MITRPTALIGRESELERLDQSLAAVEAGRSSFQLLVGEAGIGKTRLLSEARARSMARGLRTLHGVAIESGAGLPYLPLLTAISESLNGRGLEGSSAQIRAALFVRPGRDAPAAASDGRSQDEVGAALLLQAVFEVLTARPTVLLIDDVQWADASTLTVLDYLAHRGVDSAIAVIAAARDDERDPIERLAIADGRRYVHIPVPRLTREQVATQVETILGSAPPALDVDSIFRRTVGNPFFVEQVVASLVDLADRADEGAPAQLRALVLRRIRGLAPHSRAALDVLAILGRASPGELVSRIGRVTLNAVVSAMAEGARAGVVESDEHGYALRHPLFGEVIRHELAGPVRMELHRRAAEALADLVADPAVVAEHWWQAGAPRQSWAAAVAAADAARRTPAFGEQLLHLLRAIEVWPEDEPGHGAAILDAAHAAWMTGDPVAALRLARDAETSLLRVIGGPGGSSQDHALGLELLLAEGAFAWDAGDRDAAVRAFDQAHLILTDSTPPRSRSRAMWGLGRARIGERAFSEALEFALRAASFAREANDHVEEAEDLLLAGMAVAWAGGADGVAYLEEGRRLALAARAPSTIGHAHQFLVDILALSGAPERALQTAIEGITVTEELGLGRSHAADLRGRAALLFTDMGRYREAAEPLVGAEPRAYPLLARARLALRRGSYDEAATALDEAATGGAIGGPGSLGGWLELTHVEMANLRGDDAVARTWLGRVPEVPGIWGLDVAAWTALWVSRLGPSVDVQAGLATVGRHPDAALRRALGAEIAAMADALLGVLL